MHLPANSNDYIRAGLAGIFVIGAIVLQANNADIPSWLAVGLTGIASYYFGLSSDSRKPSEENDD